MKYLLDTGTCIFAMKQKPTVLERMLSKPRSDIALSVITEGELRTGAAKSSSPIKTLKLVENFFQPLAILELTSADISVYAQVQSKLESAGTPIGPLDTLIAAQAVARQLILVTNNEREFQRIKNLRLENWL